METSRELMMSAGEYDDLEIRIDRDADGSYRVLAMAPDGRTARGSFTSPVSDAELDDFVLRVGLARRRGGSAEDRMEAIRSLGSTLFDALIRDDVSTVYYSARSAAAERERGLRLTLRLSGSPELMRLPWEFLYKRPRFIAQSTRTPVVRALDVDSAMHPQRVRLPLRILGMVSSPSGYPELDAIAERANLERALEGPRRAGLVELTWLERATLAELARRVAEPDEIHVLHYIGHGAYDEATESGVLVLETPQGRAHDVSGEDIGSMLQDETSLRLVVLNACEGARTSHVDPFSGVATSLVNFDIPAVIGMQFEITDDAAIPFSESLYTGLARGLPIDAALAPARRAIIGAMLATEFGTPVLFLRDGDARLFDIEDARTEGTAAPAATTTTIENVVEKPIAVEPEPVRSPEVSPSVPGAVREPERVAEEPPDVAAADAEHVDEVSTSTVGPIQAASVSPIRGAAAADGRGPSSVAAPIALAWIAAAMLAVAAWMVVPVWIAWTIEAAVAQYLAQTMAAAALSVHHLTRPNRDGAAAALYGLAAGGSVFALSNSDGDWSRVMSASVVVGLALIAVGIRLAFVGTKRPSPYAPSARIPAPFAVLAGTMFLVAAIVWFNGAWDWQPFASETLAFAILGLAAGSVLSALLLAGEAKSQQDGHDREGPSTGSGPRFTAAVALAGLAVVLFAYTGWMLVAAALRPEDWYELAPVAVVGQTLALATLSAHHVTRPDREAWVVAAGYAVAAGASAFIVSNMRTDLPLSNRGVPVVGLILIAVGGWLAVVGRRSGSRFAASLRAPAPFAIVAGTVYLIASLIWFGDVSDWAPLVEWILPFAVVGMAIGYAISAVLLAREARVLSEGNGAREPSSPGDEIPFSASPVEEPVPSSAGPSKPVPARGSGTSATEDAGPESYGGAESGSTPADPTPTRAWTAAVTYERVAKRRTKATLGLRLSEEHEMVLTFGVGWKTLEVDGAFVPIPRAGIARFGLRDGGVERTCVLESSATAAGMGTAESPERLVLALAVDSVSIPIRQSEDSRGKV